MSCLMVPYLEDWVKVCKVLRIPLLHVIYSLHESLLCPSRIMIHEEGKGVTGRVSWQVNTIGEGHNRYHCTTPNSVILGHRDCLLACVFGFLPWKFKGPLFNENALLGDKFLISQPLQEFLYIFTINWKSKVLEIRAQEKGQPSDALEFRP